MRVRIKKDLTKTKEKWGVALDMKDMCGNIYDVEKEYDKEYMIDGYTFCKEDCEIIEDNPPKYTADSVTMLNDKKIKHTITFDFVNDLSTKEIATAMCLLSTLGYNKSDIQKMVKDDDTLKVGDKVFINFTCECDEYTSNGVRLDELMLRYNHTIQIVESVNNKGCQLKNTPFNYSFEWLTKVVE